MQTQSDQTNFYHIENTLKFQEEENQKTECEQLIQQLQGARKNLKEKFLKETQLEQSGEENYLSKTLEDTGQLNSINITISYYESRKIEDLLTNLQENRNYLQQKLIKYSNQGVLERQLDFLEDQLSKERLKYPKDKDKINNLKEQLRLLKIKLKEKIDILCAQIDIMLKPLEDEFDDDVQVIYSKEK